MGQKCSKEALKSKIKSQFYNLRLIFKLWVTYFWKIFEDFRKYAFQTPEIKKKKRKFSLKTAEAKKKNKKKTGSNDEKLRKLEPQQKQRVLIKKN